MIVRMYMTREVEVVSPDASLVEVVRKMQQRRIRRVVVEKGGQVVGMISQRDVINAFPSHINPFSVMGLEGLVSVPLAASVMKFPVVTVEQVEPIEKAASLMTQHHVGGLPVVNDERLVGIITESDIFRALTLLLAGEEGAVRITFDLTEDENALLFLVEATRRLGLILLSFISFHDGSRRMAVARVRGEQVRALVNELWESGHTVVNILDSGN